MKRYIFTAVALTSLAAGVTALAADSTSDMKDMNTKPKASTSQQQPHVAKGTVRKVDAKSGRVTITHEPIASMNWPAMTMAFEVKDQRLLEKLATGKQVHFEFVRKANQYLITAVH